MSVATFTKSGSKATTPAKLDKKVFGEEVKSHELLKQAYVAYLANGRDNLAVAKKRGEVRGGGRKPWRQKGTGRARFGSSRNPIWRGGGAAFGPTGEENYSKSINTKAKRLAIRQALSLSAKADKIAVIESFDAKDGKTKTAAGLLEKLGAKRATLLVVTDKTDPLARATGNLPGVIVVNANYLNVYDIMNADHIVFTAEALKTATQWLGKAE